MSIRLMSMIWDVQFPTQSQLLIALKLADFANDSGGSIFPSRNTLAKQAQCSETTIKNTLRAFREIGLLKVVREGGNGPKDTTEYEFDLGLVKAVIDGECTIEGSAIDLEIKGSNKGSISAPLDEIRGQSDELRGQSLPLKGSTGCPQYTNNHHLEPSRASAREVDKSGLGSEGKKPSKALPCFKIVPADSSWGAWIDYLRERDSGMAFDANQSKKIVASTRWPKPESEVFHPKPMKPVGCASRIIGEGDAA
jgi:Helix-turn-helix domain